MLTDEHAVGEARGYRVRGRVRQTKRRRVSAQGIVGGDGFRHQIRSLRFTPILQLGLFTNDRPGGSAYGHIMRQAGALI